MTIAFLTGLPDDAAERWLGALRAALPGDDVVAGLTPDAEVAVVAAPISGELAKLPRLGFIQSAWAGVDGLLADPLLPRPVPLARLPPPFFLAGS